MGKNRNKTEEEIRDELISKIESQENTSVTMDADDFKRGEGLYNEDYLSQLASKVKRPGKSLTIKNSNGLPEYLRDTLVSLGKGHVILE